MAVFIFPERRFNKYHNSISEPVRPPVGVIKRTNFLLMDWLLVIGLLVTGDWGTGYWEISYLLLVIENWLAFLTNNQ